MAHKRKLADRFTRKGLVEWLAASGMVLLFGLLVGAPIWFALLYIFGPLPFSQVLVLTTALMGGYFAAYEAGKVP